MSAYTDAKALANQAQTFTREQWAHETNMSNTAHQREVEDLKKAGLNPVLSSGGTGATYSSTSGDSGTGAAASLISADYSAKAQLKASAQQAAATKYAAQMSYKAAAAQAAAQIQSANIAAKLERDSWKSKPVNSVAGGIDKYLQKAAKVLGINSKLFKANKPKNIKKALSQYVNVKVPTNAKAGNNAFKRLNVAGQAKAINFLKKSGFNTASTKYRNLVANFFITGNVKYLKTFR